jgi:ribosomal protein S18 acetylase RimI-like enzyme
MKFHQGIASNFIQSLINKKLNDCKAVFLEVQPNNRDALKLYTRLGFKKDENSYLKYAFSA